MDVFHSRRKIASALALAAAIGVVLTGCATAPSPTGTSATSSGKLGCLVADTAGINDNGFNSQAWAGLQRAQKELGANVKYLQSRSQDDYATNITAFVGQKCDLIVTVGFLEGDATSAASKTYPDSNFAIVDVSYNPVLPNVTGMQFATDQGAFLAGYASAAASKTGVVGTFGGVKIAPVELYMDGFARGVEYYNQKNQKSVKILGWDTAAEDGTFTGDFTDQEKASQIAKGMMQQGADVIYPVASTAALGAYAAIKANGNGVLAIKGDVDGCTALPDYCGIFLTSILKNSEVAVFDTMKQVTDGSFKGSTYVGTLANDGVGITGFDSHQDRVSPQVQSDINDIKSQLIDGSLKVGSPFTVSGN
jgi:basic membrane protein A